MREFIQFQTSRPRLSDITTRITRAARVTQPSSQTLPPSRVHALVLLRGQRVRFSVGATTSGFLIVVVSGHSTAILPVIISVETQISAAGSDARPGAELTTAVKRLGASAVQEKRRVIERSVKQ